MDLISCRNFLIYLDASAQKRAISSFHYGLHDGGFLMLGKSETIGSSEQLFSVVDKKLKIYCRKKNSGEYRIPDLSPRLSHITMSETNNNNSNAGNSRKLPSSGNNHLSSAFDAVLLAEFIPASVIINHDLEILQFRGDTSLYLQHSAGRASFNILKMAQLEITFELRNAIHHAIKTKRIVRKKGIEMSRDLDKNTIHIVSIEVKPVEVDGEELLVVVFSGHKIDLEPPTVNGANTNTIAKDLRIKMLEEELSAARSDMGSITQDQEAANEELQSANEEIVSSNEELQSLNEELETSKEEIESTNEELTISNLELHARIQQIEDLSNYNQIILDTIHEPMLVLDKHICIVSANKSYCKTFQVTEKESLGVSLYKLGKNQWKILRMKKILKEIFKKKIIQNKNYI
jgi:two-component system CheB/CheR fusion protein